MLRRVTVFWQDQEGAAMVKYAVMFALFAAACLLLLKALGIDLGLWLYKIQSHLPAGDGLVRPTP